jgi:hypothetical protein
MACFCLVGEESFETELLPKWSLDIGGTHKFGIELPKSVQESFEIDKRIGTDHWRWAVEKEMSKIRDMGAFEPYDKASPDDLRSGREKLPGFREVGCHMVIDVKMDRKFTRKDIDQKVVELFVRFQDEIMFKMQ